MASTSSPNTNRCLYEILGVSRDCSVDEIRAAYKRLALQLHPDKVSSSSLSPSESTAAFQQLLHAYQVLSDPKERAWYDSHRSQILFSNPNTNSNNKASSFFDVDLFAYFTPSAYSGFSNTGKGFYKVYGDLFAKLYNNELFFCSRMGISNDVVQPAPLIGNLESDYAQVMAFYNYWLGFSTVMDFSWVDEFDVSVGPNRRSRRFMEEENKKVRKKARREYNDSVRGLAAFVKKRDKRVIEMAAKKAQEEERRREEEKRKKEEEKRRRAERVMSYEEPEWARVDQDEVAEENDDLVFDELKGERRKKKGGGEEFYCVACNKKFKSEKQWKNHEQSKKHREKIADLRESFREEEEVISGGGHDDDGEETYVDFEYVPPSEDEDDDTVAQLCEEFEDDLELQEGRQDEAEVDAGNDNKGTNKEEEDDENDEASILKAMLSGRNNRKSRRIPSNGLSSKQTSHLEDDEENSMAYDTERGGRRNRGRCRAAKSEDDYSHEPGRDNTQEKTHEYVTAGNTENAKDDGSYSLEDINSLSKENRVSGNNQSSKKQVEAKARKKDVNAGSKNTRERKQKGTKAPTNACETCGESFESRNKLFAHLGDTGHAMLKSR